MTSSDTKRWHRMTIAERRAEAARLVHEQRVRQGLPAKVEEPAVLRRLARSLAD